MGITCGTYSVGNHNIKRPLQSVATVRHYTVERIPYVYQ